ncbi:MAG: ribonuclease J [Dehalococcoidales bacterium]|nr:ribonuclease J [Dehalococcoidales bacterium]
MAKSKLRIIPLGGLNEIGKNMMLLEYENDIIIIDAGLMFPEEEMMGVDLVIPDISYLIERRQKIRGMVITHGHEDHIGALPYLLPQLNCPVYCTKLTHGLISVKLKEHKALAKADLRILTPGVKIALGKFRVELFPVCHSIPDSAGIIVHTPLGVVVHSGDFKIDYTPVNSNPTDFSRLAQLGSEGVLLLMTDSTYAELPGYTPSESVVGDALERIMSDAPGRVIITTFSSLVSRIQQVIDTAARYNRRVFVVGRNMNEIVRISLELGYLKAPAGILGRIDEMKNLPDNRIVLVTTGSQGEPTSALVRIANKDHKQVHIMKGDTVIISASPIPGNESLVARTIDNLLKQGAEVLYDRITPVHVHGHASQEELKLIMNIVKPKYFMPIHGEYRHLYIHGKLAQTVGIPKENIFIMEDGDILQIDKRSARVDGRVSSGHVYVDGMSVGDIGATVLRDRQALAEDGIVIVIVAVNKQTGRLLNKPDIMSKGFVDSQGYQEMLENSRDVVAEALKHRSDSPSDPGYLNNKIRDTLERYYYEQTKRHPMILPFVVRV